MPKNRSFYCSNMLPIKAKFPLVVVPFYFSYFAFITFFKLSGSNTRYFKLYNTVLSCFPSIFSKIKLKYFFLNNIIYLIYFLLIFYSMNKFNFMSTFCVFKNEFKKKKSESEN